MINDDDLRVAILQALSDYGAQDAAGIAALLPARFAGLQGPRIHADLRRLEGKGLLKEIRAFKLSDEGQAILKAVADIKLVFPGPGAPGQPKKRRGRPPKNGAAESTDTD